MKAIYSPTHLTLTAVSAPDPANPSLSIGRQNQPLQALVCWPSEFTNFGLYFKTNLNQADWTLIPAVTNRFIENPLANPQEYFELIN